MWKRGNHAKAVAKLLNQAEQVEIELATSYNHALFCALNPDTPVRIAKQATRLIVLPSAKSTQK
jgi:hypothetical protein